jgi:hypothetical protein
MTRRRKLLMAVLVIAPTRHDKLLKDERRVRATAKAGAPKR